MAAHHHPPPPGIYVPVPTFFQPRSSPTYNSVVSPLDLSTQCSHALYLARAGITGLVILGSTGEAVAITSKERIQIISSVRQTLEEAGFKDYPIIAGTATQGIEDTIELLVQAKEAGAQTGLCLAPGYNATATTQEGIRKWYEAIADRSPMPIMIYYYPSVSNNVKVAPATVAALSQHPNIVGCKLSHGDVSYHAQIGSHPQIKREGFAAFTGLGQQLVAVLAVGCAGTIDATAGFFPKSVVHLYGLCTSVEGNHTPENMQEIRALQYKLCAVEELVVKYGTVGIKESISRVLGFGDRDGTRLPMCGGIPGGDAEWENYKAAYAELEAVEKSLPMKHEV